METSTSIYKKLFSQILYYIKGTINYMLFYSSSNKFKLIEFCDSNPSRNINDRKSTNGFVFFKVDCDVSWCFKKQLIIILLIGEFKLMAVDSCIYHAICRLEGYWKSFVCFKMDF